MYKFFGAAFIMILAVNCNSESQPVKECAPLPSAASIKKTADYSGVWTLSTTIISMNCSKITWKNVPTLTKLQCNELDTQLMNKKLVISDNGNQKVGIGLREDCQGKNFDGHLVANCSDEVIKDTHQYDFKMVNPSTFAGTYRYLLNNDNRSVEIMAKVTGTKD